MIIIQYTLSIPKDSQAEFIQYSKDVLAPTWKKYGCIRYECAQIEEQQIVGRQVIESGRYVERLYFNDDFDILNFYHTTREQVPEVTKAYETQFGAHHIELRILRQLS